MIPSLVPDNNPHERINLEIKGSKTLRGVINPGQDYLTMLTKELPNLIRAFSLLRVGVEYNIKVDEEDIVLHPRSKIMEGLLTYSNRFVEEIDMRKITSKDNNKSNEQTSTYLVNTKNYVGQHVTKQHVQQYFDTLNGKIYATEENRSTAYRFVESLCLVNEIIKPDGTLTYYGNCHTFFKTTYCNHCARFVYREQLQSLSRKIPHGRRSREKHEFLSSKSDRWRLKFLFQELGMELLSMHQCFVIKDVENCSTSRKRQILKAESLMKDMPNILKTIETITKTNIEKVNIKEEIANKTLVTIKDINFGLKDINSNKFDWKNFITMLEDLKTNLNLLVK